MHDRIEVAPGVFRRVQQSRAVYSDVGQALPPLNVARQQNDGLFGKKLRVCTGVPMDKLPMLAIGHDWRLPAYEAASRHELQSRDADLAAPVSAFNEELNPARVDPVLRVLVGRHLDVFLSWLISSNSRENRERPIHQKACSANLLRRPQRGSSAYVLGANEGASMTGGLQPKSCRVDLAPMALVHQNSLTLRADCAPCKRGKRLQAHNTDALTRAFGERELHPRRVINVFRARVHTLVLHERKVRHTRGGIDG